METLANIFQAEIVQRLGWTLVHFIWQATAVAIILAIVLRLLRKSSANLRYITCCTALVLIVLMPIVTIKLIDVTVVSSEYVRPAASQLQIADTTAEVIVEIPQIEPPAKAEERPITARYLAGVPFWQGIVRGVFLPRKPTPIGRSMSTQRAKPP